MRRRWWRGWQGWWRRGSMKCRGGAGAEWTPKQLRSNSQHHGDPPVSGGRRDAASCSAAALAPTPLSTPRFPLPTHGPTERETFSSPTSFRSRPKPRAPSPSNPCQSRVALPHRPTPFVAPPTETEEFVFRKQKSIVGLDLGSSVVKAVEISLEG